jgi:hypothetical protein
MNTWAAIIVACAQAYAAVGGAVALAYLCFGLDRREPSARNAYAFRALIAPGLVLLWPLVLARWSGLPAGTRPPHPRVHVIAWTCLALVVPALLTLGLVMRSRPLPPATSLEISSVRVAP